MDEKLDIVILETYMYKGTIDDNGLIEGFDIGDIKDIRKHLQYLGYKRQEEGTNNIHKEVWVKR